MNSRPNRVQAANKRRQLSLAVGLGVTAIPVAWTVLGYYHPAPAKDLDVVSGITFGSTVPNAASAPATAPTGMVWIPGGEFSMGAQDSPGHDQIGMKATVDSRPVHR